VARTLVLGPEDENHPEARVPITYFRVKVQQAIHGLIAAESTVEVPQTGGTLANGRTTQAENDPLMTVGETAVFFLFHFVDEEQAPDGAWGILGGPEGRFIVSQGANPTVTQLNPFFDLGVNGEPLAEFVEQIRAALP
jgi:hypothetical protein